MIEVRLNGALINQFTSTDPARDLSATKLGIQNHGAGDEVYFRRIQVATPDAGAAELDLEVKPKRRSVKPGRTGTFRATLRNTGDAAADGRPGLRHGAEVARRDRGPGVLRLPARSTRTTEPRGSRSRRSARPPAKVRLRFIADGHERGQATETATLKVKKKKRKRGR